MSSAAGLIGALRFKCLVFHDNDPVCMFLIKDATPILGTSTFAFIVNIYVQGFLKYVCEAVPKVIKKFHAQLS